MPSTPSGALAVKEGANYSDLGPSMSPGDGGLYFVSWISLELAWLNSTCSACEVADVCFS